MNSQEAKQLMSKYLLPVIEKYGFTEKKARSSDFEFVRKTKSGLDFISGGFTNYNPVQRIVYGLSKVNKTVNGILIQLQEKGMKFTPPVTANTPLISMSYERLHKLDFVGYLPDMQTEADVAHCVRLMLEYLENTALPDADRFEDLREIDKIINGAEPWKTDWQATYVFGGYFHLTRLIIAKLAGGNNYERMLQIVSDDFRSQFDGPYGAGFRDTLDQVHKLHEILKSVQAIY